MIRNIFGCKRYPRGTSGYFRTRSYMMENHFKEANRKTKDTLGE